VERSFKKIEVEQSKRSSELEMLPQIERRLSFNTIVALYSENTILNKSVRSLCNSFLVVVTTGYNTMVGIKLLPFYVIERPGY